MKKKIDHNQRLLDELGLLNPRRVVREGKPKIKRPQPDSSDGNLEPTFQALRKLVAGTAKNLIEVDETETWPAYRFFIDVNGGRHYLFGVFKNMRHVSIEIPNLVDKNVEPFFPKALHPRRHGKWTLNFVEIDRKLFAHLEKFILQILQMARNAGWV